MGIIKEDMISDRIGRRDLLPMSFLKKSVYTGSKRKLRYRLEKALLDEEGDELPAGTKDAEAAAKKLKCSTWMGPLCYAATGSSEISVSYFEFNDSGIDDAIEHLNRVLAESEKSEHTQGS